MSEDLLAEFEAIEAELGGSEGTADATQKAEKPASGSVAVEPAARAASKADSRNADANADANANSDAAAASKRASDADALAELRELAKKHGFALSEETQTVAARERVAFREEKRRARAELEAERAAFLRDREAETLRLQQTGRSVIEAAQAFERGDWDAFAKALGEKDWNAVNERVLNAFADPNYKRLRELERRELEREQSQQTAQQQQREQAAREAQQREIDRYCETISGEMAESSDKFVAAMSDDPRFVNAIFRIRQQHYQETGEELALDEAVKIKPRGGTSLREQMAVLYKKLRSSGAFDEPEEPSDRARKPESGPRPRNGEIGSQSRNAAKPKTSISQSEAGGPSRNLNLDDDREWRKYALAELERAADEDKRRRRA